MAHLVKTLWVNGALPPAQHACLRSFVLCGHEVDLFVYDRVTNIPEGVRTRDAREILPQSSIFVYGPAAGRSRGGLAGFSNLFRYAMLLAEGGCWIDTDVFCLGPLPEGELVVASERNPLGARQITNCLMRCPPGHILAARCLEKARAIDPREMTFTQTGPALVDLTVRQLGLGHAVLDPSVVCPVDWPAFERLASPAGMTACFGPAAVFPPQARCVHLWNEMFRVSAGPIPWPGATGSVMHHLRQRLDRMEHAAATDRAAREHAARPRGIERCASALSRLIAARVPRDCA